VDLAADNPALAEGRTIFPSTVVGTMESPRFLVSGHNNPKLGKEVQKGPRAGWPIFHLTLEERATCPRSCPVWAGCYGNAMPFARRHRGGRRLQPVAARRGGATREAVPGGLAGPAAHPRRLLLRRLRADVGRAARHARRQLHVFGYTARRVDDEDPETRKIASAIAS
jgi:hypothetical protein